MQAIIKSSGRLIEIELDGDQFWYIRPICGWRDRLLRQYGITPVGGPWPLTDPRFVILEERHETA